MDDMNPESGYLEEKEIVGEQRAAFCLRLREHEKTHRAHTGHSGVGLSQLTQVSRTWQSMQEISCFGGLQ